MAGNYPFHGKLHRSTHHTTPTPGIIESGSDPVAGLILQNFKEYFLPKTKEAVRIGIVPLQL